MSDLEGVYDASFSPKDDREVEARDSPRQFFDTNKESVFFSRQLEVQNENEYFHWLTNRALRDLEAEGLLKSERRMLATGTAIKLLWRKGYRFCKRSARQVVALVEQ